MADAYTKAELDAILLDPQDRLRGANPIGPEFLISEFRWLATLDAETKRADALQKRVDQGTERELRLEEDLREAGRDLQSERDTDAEAIIKGLDRDCRVLTQRNEGLKQRLAAKNTKYANLKRTVADVEAARVCAEGHNAALNERLRELQTEIDKARDEAWSAESWFLRHMAKSKDPATRDLAKHYPAHREEHQGKLRGLLDRLVSASLAVENHRSPLADEDVCQDYDQALGDAQQHFLDEAMKGAD